MMRPLLTASLLCLALALSACGGGEEESATTAPGAQQQGSGPLRNGGEAAGNRAGAGSGDGTAVNGAARGSGDGARGGGSEGRVDLTVDPARIEGARVTGTGAVQTLPPRPRAQRTAQKNSYASIRSFGTEAEGEEATAITFALAQYLDAKAKGDWATACARLYSVLRESLEGAAKGESCPQVYGGLMSRSSRSSREEQARIDVSSVRRGPDNRAFVIYKTPATLSADMPMYVEGGVWKVGAIETYALRPEQAG